MGGKDQVQNAINCVQILKQKISEIKDKDDFVHFVELLVRDLNDNPNEWENQTLSEYLEGIAIWTEDMDGYYHNNNMPTPENIDWKVFANILIAAKMYEQLKDTALRKDEYPNIFIYFPQKRRDDIKNFCVG